MQQLWILAASAIRVFDASFASHWQVRQWLGQQLILTSSVFQSTSGLCLCNQVSPKIVSCFPRLVTVNIAHSEWSQYRNTMSMTSRMLPASFCEPSMWYTGISWLNCLVVSHFCFMKSAFRNIPVAPESSSALVEWISPVLVVCIDISSSSKFAPGFEVTMYCSRRHFSHLGWWWGILGMARISLCLVGGNKFDSEILSTVNNLKQLYMDSSGIPITHCCGQNLGWLHPLPSLSLFHQPPRRLRLRKHLPQRLVFSWCSCIVCWSIWGILVVGVPTGHTRSRWSQYLMKSWQWRHLGVTNLTESWF